MKHASHLDHSPFLVPAGRKIKLNDYDPAFTSGFKNKAEAKEALAEDVSTLAKAQQLLWASKQYAVLVIFQAMDAAGKDGAIRHVMSGVNPQGVDVFSFKAPTEEELLHPYLWRFMKVTPPAGRIAIFNRSYYEEVLVVRVHPVFLEKQRLPLERKNSDLKQLWKARYQDMNNFEKTLTRYNTLVLKFFLNLSKKEQKKRFLKRLENPDKHWKFSAADIRERSYWDDYMEAFEDLLNATSTPEAPWYIIPADRKWFTRACVADIIAARIEELDLKIPNVTSEQKRELEKAKRQLEKK